MAAALKGRFDRKPIGEVLVEKGLLSATDRDLIIKKSERTGARVGQILVDDGYISDTQLAKNIAEIYQLPFFDLDDGQTLTPQSAGLTEPFAREHKLIVLASDTFSLKIATNDPSNIGLLSTLPAFVNKKIDLFISPLSQIQDKQKDFTEHAKPILKTLSPDIADSANMEQLVRSLVDAALEQDASDIHIEGALQHVRVRFRVHGILRESRELSSDIHLPLIAKLKVMGNLDVAEKRIAQDGSFSYTGSAKTVDVRLSTLPTIQGEKAVLRILDKSTLKTKLEDLGMNPTMSAQLGYLTSRPSGLLLLTGPTGSGKTTTVYSLIELFNKTEKNLVTVEDPVEYRMDKITQVQIHLKAGITFPSALRSMLRQDPDVIVIGEIRDRETAEIAIRASLTGHIVVSTLHTNDSVSAIHRLMDMGIEPYLIASALLGILSQRLVRVLCPKCRKTSNPLASQLKLLNDPELRPDSVVGEAGAGCSHCSTSGFKGRQGIFELFTNTPEIKELITLRAPSSEIFNILRANQFQTMREDGIKRALKGITTLDEILKQTV